MTLIANGLARFGYIVLIPLLILSNKLTEEQSYQLGIALLIGYIFGSSAISLLQRYFYLEVIAKFSLLVIALSFFACSLELPFFLAWLWRFLAGGASASLIILAAPLSLPYVRAKNRTNIAGLIFSGIGSGTVLSGLILPFLALKDMNLAWYFLGSLSLLAFFFSLFALKNKNPPKNKESSVRLEFSALLWFLLISYALNAIAYLPHTLFWVDYLIRELNIEEKIAGSSWSLFGVGAICGSLMSGFLGAKMGARNAHIVVLLLKALSCFMALFGAKLFWLNLSVFLMGFGTIGNVVLASAMSLQLVGKKYFASSMSALTFAFGLGQAVFSLIFVYILGYVGYFWLFVGSGIALILSALLLFPFKNE